MVGCPNCGFLGDPETGEVYDVTYPCPSCGLGGAHVMEARVASRFLRRAAYFNVGDVILFGKYKNKRGRIVGFGKDPHGNPTVEIEPIPKGRKSNKVFGLFKIWKVPPPAPPQVAPPV